MLLTSLDATHTHTHSDRNVVTCTFLTQASTAIMTALCYIGQLVTHKLCWHKSTMHPGG